MLLIVEMESKIMSLGEKILYIYALWVVLTFLVWLFSGGDWCDLNVTPMDIYNCTDMNLFGSTLAWLLQLVIMPIPVIAAIIISFIYWLCHVGRKNS